MNDNTLQSFMRVNVSDASLLGAPIFPGPVLDNVAVWCSGNALVLINAVALHRARLVLGWVTAFG